MGLHSCPEKIERSEKTSTDEVALGNTGHVAGKTRWFLPNLETDLSQHHCDFCTLAPRPCQMKETWCLAGLHLINKTMSANEIITVVSARPEHLPGGLGILQVESIMEP